MHKVRFFGKPMLKLWLKKFLLRTTNTSSVIKRINVY